MNATALSVLTKTLISSAANYSTYAQPKFLTKVFVTFFVAKLLKLSSNGVLDMTGALTFSWNDSRLAWDPAQFDGIDYLFLPTNLVWTPSVALFNTANNEFRVCGNSSSKLLITALGSLTWTASKRIVASCSLDFVNFPFDTQQCNLTYLMHRSSSTMATVVTLPAVHFYKNPLVQSSVAYDVHSDSGEFALQNVTVAVSENSTKCFSEYECYHGFVITLRYKRHATSYVTNLIVPGLLLISLLPLGFLLPSENSMRISMSCSLMVSLYVLQQDASRLLPAGSDHTFTSIGCMLCLVLGCISVMCSVITLKVYTRAKASSYANASAFAIHSSEPELFSRRAESENAQDAIDQRANESATLTDSSTSEQVALLRKMVDLLEVQEAAQLANANRDDPKARKKNDFKMNVLILAAIVLLAITGTLAVHLKLQ